MHPAMVVPGKTNGMHKLPLSCSAVGLTLHKAAFAECFCNPFQDPCPRHGIHHTCMSAAALQCQAHLQKAINVCTGTVLELRVGQQGTLLQLRISQKEALSLHGLFSASMLLDNELHL